MLRPDETRNVGAARRAVMSVRSIAALFAVGFSVLVQASAAPLLAASAAFLLAASAAGAQTAPPSPYVALKVGAIGAVSDAGIFIAQEKGFFKSEGLDVELVSFKAAPQILPAIATNEVQISGSAVSPALFNAFARGIVMNLSDAKGHFANKFVVAAIVIHTNLHDTVKVFGILKSSHLV